MATSGYGPAYQQMQWAPPMPDFRRPQMPTSLPPITPMHGGMPGGMQPGMQPGMAPGGGGGGWLGALGRATGWNDMSGMEKGYLGLSAIGGVADWWERKSQRDEERRRYEEGLAEDRMHRRRMGEQLSRAWGG